MVTDLYHAVGLHASAVIQGLWDHTLQEGEEVV